MHDGLAFDVSRVHARINRAEEGPLTPTVPFSLTHALHLLYTRADVSLQVCLATVPHATREKEPADVDLPPWYEETPHADRQNDSVCGVSRQSPRWSHGRRRAPAAGDTTDHIMVTPEAVQWVDAPSSVPAGAKWTVLEGDPLQAGPFTFRVTVPAGFKMPPHTHSNPVEPVQCGGCSGVTRLCSVANGRFLPASTILPGREKVHHNHPSYSLLTYGIIP
jgi:hypothetical protein